MKDRIKKLREGLLVEKYPICCEMAILHTESFRETEGKPLVIRVAKAFANALDKITIFIEDGELIVGNTASKPRGIELSFISEQWPQSAINALSESMYMVSQEVTTASKALNDYWRGKNLACKIQGLYNERIWPVVETGIYLPQRERGDEVRFGGTKSGSGIGLGVTQLICPDFERVLNDGLIKIKEEAEQELRSTKIKNYESLQKVYFLQAVIISHEAAIRFANRFSVLAMEMASEEKDPIRKKELEKISETCQWVPANPARDFYEAAQSLWFVFNMLCPQATMALGRFDQYMYPFYKKDREEGRITDEEVLELLQCLRIKFSELMIITADEVSRLGPRANSVWLNATIDGQTPDGKDAANELSYLILEAAKRCKTPHHTITVRVHEDTPEDLMLKALEVVKTGLGMPAFVGDKSYIKFFTSHGVSLETARDFVLLGCLDGGLAHKSRIRSYGFIITPMVLELALNDGVNPMYGIQVGPRTGDAENFESFDDLMEAFKEQLAYCLNVNAEINDIDLLTTRESDPNPFLSSLMDGRIKRGKEIGEETLFFDQEETMSPIGMINVADSMAAIKKLVYDEKRVSMKELKATLAANWQGDRYMEIRKMCLAAPKYGNDDDYVDLIARDLYRFWAETTVKHDDALGGKQKPSSISVIGHWRAGYLTGALPDGRYAGEVLADGSTSPMRGRDIKGPTAVIKSAGKIEQHLYAGTLMNMKFHPSALNTTEDLRKLSALIKTYLVDLGGEHIQFNVVSRETLEGAQNHPENYRDLIVRVAGFSAYFVQLGKGIQDEIIARTENQGVGV